MLKSFVRIAQITSQSKNVKCRNLVTSHSPHAWIFSKVFGPVGFIIANCCNFAMRIVHSCYVIHKHNGSEALKGLLPTVTTFLCLISSGIICNLSENFIYDPNELGKIWLHLIIGGLFFVITIVVMFFSEKDIVNSIRNKEHAE